MPFPFITKQTKWYEEKASRLKSLSSVFADHNRQFIPMGIHRKTLQVVTFFEYYKGTVKIADIITHGSMKIISGQVIINSLGGCIPQGIVLHTRINVD